MRIHNHRLVDAPFVDTPNKSGEIDPKFIVMHYTAGWTAESAINTLKDPARQASAHVVVDYDGTITQMVPFNIKAWHAGRSRYEGYNGLNTYSIGIEIVNIGWLRKLNDGTYQDAYGNRISESDSRISKGLIKARHSRVGSGEFYWPAYEVKQLEAVEDLTRLLVKEYDITNILSHEEIDTRGWKTDPGPAFPMNRFKSLLNDRGDEMEVYIVDSDTPLNVRKGPGTEFDVVMEFVKGTPVMIEEISGNWVRIDSSHWVHKGFLKKL